MSVNSLSQTPIIVADSTPLIALSKIGQLYLLPEIFSEVIVPEAVYNEVVIAGANRSGSTEVSNADWIKIQPVANYTKVNYLLEQLNLGEAEAIVLAQEINSDWLLIDEKHARTISQHLGLQIIGTAGILLTAKREGKIDSVRPFLDSLRNHQFRLSDQVYHSVLKQADEIE